MIGLSLITLLAVLPLDAMAMSSSPLLTVSAAPSLPSAILAPTDPSDAEKAIDRAKAAEIIASEDAQTERRIDKFLQLVVLPLGICLALIVLLRGRVLH